MRTRGTRLSGDPGWNAPGNLSHPLKIGLLAGLVALVSLFGTETQAQLPSVPGATYLGAEVCKGCHADQAAKLEHTLHGKLLGTDAARTDLQRRGCEACHGPGSAHVAAGGGVQGRGLAFNSSTGHVFVANPEDGTVSVVDGASARILTTLTVGRWPNRIAVNPNTNRVYVTNRDDGSLSVIEDR